jgi:hypothetical protein
MIKILWMTKSNGIQGCRVCNCDICQFTEPLRGGSERNLVVQQTLGAFLERPVT